MKQHMYVKQGTRGGIYHSSVPVDKQCSSGM